MTAVGCQWNHDGTILAIAGTMTVSGGGGMSGGETKESNVVQFYNPHGDHLRTLKASGFSFTSVILLTTTRAFFNNVKLSWLEMVCKLGYVLDSAAFEARG